MGIVDEFANAGGEVGELILDLQECDFSRDQRF